MSKKFKISDLFRLNSLRNRLVLSFFVVGTLFLFAMAVSFLRTLNIGDYSQNIVEIHDPIQQDAQGIILILDQNIHLLQKRIYVKSNEPQEFQQQTVDRIRLSLRSDIKQRIKDLEQVLSKPQSEYLALGEALENIEKEIFDLEQSYENAFIALEKKALIFQNENYLQGFIYYNEEVEQILNEVILPRTQDIVLQINDIKDKNDILRKNEETTLNFYLDILLYVELVFYLLIIIIAVLLTNSLLRYLVKDLNILNKYILKLLKGALPSNATAIASEFEMITNSLNELKRELGKLKYFAEDVGEGYYNTDANLFQGKGEVGKAIKQMQDGLHQVSDDNEVQNWRSTGISLFGDVLRNHADNPQELAESILSELIHFLGLNQGAFYVLESAHDDKVMVLKASYAFDRDQEFKAIIREGQGLVGQIWKEKTPTYLEEVPENYMKIDAGLGKIPPKAIYIVPLMGNQEVQAVIELASLKDIPENHKEFIQAISETTALAIATARNNEETRKKLAKTEQNSALFDVSGQDRKVERFSRDLIENTRGSEDSPQSFQDLMLDTSSIPFMAIDTTYQLKSINREMRKIFLLENVALRVGDNLLEVLSQELLSRYQNYYEKALSGEKFEVEFEAGTTAPTRKLLKFYFNPILDTKKRILGVSIFIYNLTELRNLEIHLKNQSKNLQILLDNTTDEIMAVDNNYQLITANEVFYQNWLQKNQVVEAGSNILHLQKNAQDRQEWQDCFDKALSGKKLSKVFEEGKFLDQKFIEYWFNPIRDEHGSIVGVSVFARDITINKKSELKIKELLLDSLDSTDEMKQEKDKLLARIEALESQDQKISS